MRRAGPIIRIDNDKSSIDCPQIVHRRHGAKAGRHHVVAQLIQQQLNQLGVSFSVTLCVLTEAHWETVEI